jgi:hypothetical protein
VLNLGTLLRRYSPLVVAGIIQLVVVLLAPSTPPVTVASGPGYSSSGIGSSATGANPATGGSAGSSPTGSASSGSATSSGAGASGATSGGTSGATTGGATGAGPVSVGGNLIGSSNPAGVVTPCAGLQPAPWAYMPPCLKFSGANGGATMPGVTASSINFVWYEGASTPAALAAIGSQSGLTYTPDQLCQALTAYTKDVNTYYQTYGRKFVPLNGPGSHSGYAQGTNCHFNYVLGSGCGQTDAACWRSDADTILAMKPQPAFVIGGVEAQAPFLDEMAKHHVLVLGQGSADSFTQPRGPYIWDWQMSMENDASFGAEYFCKKLVGKPVQFAGPEVLHSGSNPLQPPTRKIGIVYDVPDPDTFTAGATLFEHTLASCGDKNVEAFPFAADLNQVPQEMQTIAAKLKLDGITTVYLYMDLISAIPLSNDLDAEQWHPEMVISGAGAIDDDRLAQLDNQNTWKYAFGLSLTDFSLPESAYDFSKAYQASGASGTVMKLADNAWPYFWIAGDMFQVAGPSPTIGAIQAGMFGLPIMGGASPVHPAVQFGVAGDGYLAQRSVREVWYCPTQTSPENSQPGTYVPLLGSRWFQHGQIDGTVRVFPNGVCG